MAGGRLIATVALCAALLAPSSAVAAGDEASGGAVAFALKGMHGYSILSLIGAKPGHSRGEAVFLLRRGGYGATYAAPAMVTSAAIEADLGPYGEISLEPRPTGRRETLRGCDGGVESHFEGIDYVGTLEFRGEGGYTSVRKTRLPLRAGTLQGFVCPGPSGELTTSAPSDPGALLYVNGGDSGRRLSLSAKSNGPGKRAAVRISIAEGRDGVRVERAFSGLFGPSAFDWDSKLTEASLAPPAPFVGRGAFLRTASPANRWSGNLGIRFPGRPPLSLTRGSASVTLRHGEWRVSEPEPADARPVARPRNTLLGWPSTKLWPTAFATSSPPGPS